MCLPPDRNLPSTPSSFPLFLPFLTTNRTRYLKKKRQNNMVVNSCHPTTSQCWTIRDHVSMHEYANMKERESRVTLGKGTFVNLKQVCSVAFSGDASCWGITWGGAGGHAWGSARGGIRQLTVSHMMCDVKVASHLKKHCPKNSNMKGFHECTQQWANRSVKNTNPFVSRTVLESVHETLFFTLEGRDLC